MLHYQKVNEIFQNCDQLLTPAEAHGMICGFICAGHQMDGRSWLDLILGPVKDVDKNLVSGFKTILLELYQVSSETLQNMEFDFQLFLPPDEEPLQERAEALGYWCQGFLLAMNNVGVNEDDLTSHDGKEALNHILEISQLDYEMIEISEKDEEAYFEVMEYVRVAVLMIYSDIALQQEQGAQGNSGRHLH